MAVDVGKLFNAIFSTFAIIALGYAMPASGWLPKDVGKGISPLVGKLLLPCLLFEATATLEIDDINWRLVGAIAVGKVITCVGTVIVWRLFDHSDERKGSAALAGIFVGNQNDLAMGLAIIPVLFEEFTEYLYVFAAINLVLVVPAGIVMIELSRRGEAIPSSGGMQRQVSDGLNKDSCCQILVRVLLNPLVVSGFCGVIYKLVVSSHVDGGLPEFAKMPLTTAKNAFPCCALFLVGHGLLATGDTQVEQSWLAPMFLTAVKLLFTPICMQLCIRQIVGSDDASLQFGYLYGTLPTAPSTIVIASSLGLPVQSLCSSILLSTAAWAPLCFVGAIVFTTGINDQLEKALHYECIACDVLSIIGLFSLLASVLPTGAWKRCYMLLPLVAAQMIFSSLDLGCRLSPGSVSEIGFVLSSCARLCVVSFGILLIMECLGPPIAGCPKYAIVGTVVSIVTVPLIVVLPHRKNVTPDLPPYAEKCWWRSPEQEHAELFFFVGIFIAFWLLVLCVARRRRQVTRDYPAAVESSANADGVPVVLNVSMPRLTEDVSTHHTTTTSENLTPTDRDGRQEGSGIQEARKEAHLSLFSSALDHSSWHEHLLPCATNSTWFVQLLSLVGVLAFFYLVILLLVDSNNKGQAGFAVVLLLQCILANAWGFFLAVILLWNTGVLQWFKHSLRRACCPSLFEGDLRVLDGGETPFSSEENDPFRDCDYTFGNRPGPRNWRD